MAHARYQRLGQRMTKPQKSVFSEVSTVHPGRSRTISNPRGKVAFAQEPGALGNPVRPCSGHRGLAAADRRSARGDLEDRPSAVTIRHLDGRGGLQTSRPSDRSARRWLARPEAKAKLAAARDELFSRAVAVLAGTASEAAETLKRLLASKSEKIQLNAAKLALEIGAQLRDHLEIAERLAALEAKDQEREQALDYRPRGVVPRSGTA